MCRNAAEGMIEPEEDHRHHNQTLVDSVVHIVVQIVPLTSPTRLRNLV